MLGEAGEGIIIEQPFYCDCGYNIRTGKKFYANFNLVILDEAPVTFGDNVFIGPNCGFYTAGHPVDAAERNRGLEYARPITVGGSVWFGAPRSDYRRRLRDRRRERSGEGYPSALGSSR